MIRPLLSHHGWFQVKLWHASTPSQGQLVCSEPALKLSMLCQCTAPYGPHKPPHHASLKMWQPLRLQVLFTVSISLSCLLHVLRYWGRLDMSYP